MKQWMTRAGQFWGEENGPTATEYAVLLALICIAVIGAIGTFGTRMDSIYTSINDTAGGAVGL